MTVVADHVPHRLTWEAFIELPEELLRHAELHDGEVVESIADYWGYQPGLAYYALVDCGERIFHVLHPSGRYDEWSDGDAASSLLLPGFETAVTDVISQVS